MAPEDPEQEDEHGPGRSQRRQKQVVARERKRSSRKKTGTSPPAARSGCLIIGGQGSCQEWQDILVRYPMIDSVQREDFPEHGASFAYLAHFYRTGDTVEESSRAQEEFEGFFHAIGYEYDYAGNYESRWFEGIGIHTG